MLPDKSTLFFRKILDVCVNILNTKLWLAVLLIRCEPQSGLFLVPHYTDSPAIMQELFEFILFFPDCFEKFNNYREITCFFSYCTF